MTERSRSQRFPLNKNVIVPICSFLSEESNNASLAYSKARFIKHWLLEFEDPLTEASVTMPFPTTNV